MSNILPKIPVQSTTISHCEASCLVNMATRAKRFKSCSVRIASVSTSGKKRARTINLTASDSSSQNQKPDVYKETSHVQDDDVADMYDPEVLSTNSPSQPSDFSQHQCRRMKEYARWEDIREALLNCRIEEAAFFPGDIECCDCESDAEIRCVDCGHDVYFCETCAKKSHNGRNHFHVLEYFKVYVYIYVYIYVCIYVCILLKA